jgi:hypothetical protein
VGFFEQLVRDTGVGVLREVLLTRVKDPHTTLYSQRNRLSPSIEQELGENSEWEERHMQSRMMVNNQRYILAGGPV